MSGSENPFSAAQRFLQTNELPLSYLDEVVRFIEKNTAGVNMSNNANEYVDPFTGAWCCYCLDPMLTHTYNHLSGASRYQPAQSTGSSGGTEYMDPFTGVYRLSSYKYARLTFLV